MKLVYQVGSVPLFRTLVDVMDLSENVGAAAKRTYFQQRNAYYDHTPEGQRFFEETEISFSGTLTSEKNEHFLHLLARIKALTGLRDVPIIVMERSSLSTHAQIRWLVSHGIITSVESSSTYGENDNEFFKKDFSIKMKVGHSWRPLLRWYWEDRPSIAYSGTPTLQNGADTLFIQPQRYAQIGPQNYFQQWPDTYSRLAPAAWPLLYQGAVGYGTDYAPFSSFYVNSLPHLWPGLPESLYAFTGLLNQGSLEINVNGQISTLDLEALDGQLIDRGLNGLFPSDELFAGSENFIVRNGQELILVPEWDYEGSAPGEVPTGLSKIQVSGIGTVGRFAANIKFGAL